MYATPRPHDLQGNQDLICSLGRGFALSESPLPPHAHILGARVACKKSEL